MLRACEVDLRREAVKKNTSCGRKVEMDDVTNKQKVKDHIDIIQSSCSKKIPISKIINTRFSPKKTHVTNFINQNSAPVQYLQNPHVDLTLSASFSTTKYETNMKRSPCLQFSAFQTDGEPKETLAPRSPAPRRRARNQQPYICIEESETDSDTNLGRANKIISKQIESIRWNSNDNSITRKKSKTMSDTQNIFHQIISVEKTDMV